MSKTVSVKAAKGFDDPELGGFSAGIHQLPAAAAERLIEAGKVSAYTPKRKAAAADGDKDSEKK